MYLDQPRGFRDQELVKARIEMLHSEPRAQALREWAAGLAARRDAIVPWFDPAEAGIEARILIVQEAPGPMTLPEHKRRGSGFISVDNNDQTAENMWRARHDAGLDTGAIAWNIVPWYLGAASRKPRHDELADGANALLDFMTMLSNLDTVVLCGRFAQFGWKRHLADSPDRPDVRVVETWHPSPLALNRIGRRAQFITALREANTTPTHL